MARQTIASRVTEEMGEKGYNLIAQTSGTYSFAKNSNLSRKLAELGLTESDVEVRTAARAGRNRNDGYQLLIFVPK